MIIIITIQSLYSSLQSQDTEALMASGKDLSEQIGSEMSFKGVCSTRRSNARGSEFQVCGATTENARLATSVRVLWDRQQRRIR